MGELRAMADKEINIKIVTEADTSEVEDLKNELNDLSTEADNASESMEKLADSTDQVDGENIRQTSEDSQELSDNTENANESVENLVGSLGLIESTAMMDLANNIGQIGSDAENMAQGMNSAAISVGQLATNTGVAEPQMISLINNISNATFPQEEAMAYVNTLNQMGVSADQLGNSATNMDRINDATGIGYQRTMQLTQGLQAVGISADNLPASFNAIAFAQSNVNGGAGTLSQVLKTQASTINEYGLNVDQLVIIMQRLSEQGVQGRKMGSELSKVLKENNGDISAVEQALGLQSGALSNASDVTGQYAGQLQTLADEEAEHKTFIDQLGAAWEDFSLQLSPVLSPLMDVGGLIGQFGQWAMQANGILQLGKSLGILGGAEEALIPIQYAEGTAGWFSIGWIALAIALGIALGYALIWLYENNEQFRQAVDALAQAIQWFVETAFQRLQDLFNYIQQLGQWILQSVGITTDGVHSTIVGILAFIATMPISLGIVFANAIAKTLGFGDNFVQNMWNAAKNAVTAFADGIKDLSDKLKGELDAMMKQAEDFALNIPHPIAMAAKAIKTIWTDETEEKSPGYMHRKFTEELAAMEEAPLQYSTGLSRNIGNMANSMIKTYEGNGTLLTGAGGGAAVAGGDMNITFEGCTFDKQERVQEILDTLNDYFNFDNATAGRTN